MTHTVTADGGAFNHLSIAPGESFSVPVFVAGTCLYHCEIPAGMAGRVTVT